jgi:hypothetical protein
VQRGCWLLLHCLSLAHGFSRGAPEGACEEDMKPRHGFATQVGRPTTTPSLKHTQKGVVRLVDTVFNLPKVKQKLGMK